MSIKKLGQKYGPEQAALLPRIISMLVRYAYIITKKEYFFVTSYYSKREPSVVSTVAGWRTPSRR